VQNLIEKFIAGVETVNSITGKACSYSILLMMLLVVYEVFTRRILNAPTVWTYEAITMAFGFHFMMVMAYTLMHKSIVSVDLLYNKLGVKNKARLDLLTYAVFFLPFVGGVFFYSLAFAADSWMRLERSWSVFAPPVYPFKAVIPAAFGLLLLQGLAEFLKRILILKGETS